MERYMYQEESFEAMLKQKADEYRMYPKGFVWENIQQQVHKKSYLINPKSISLTVLLLTFFSIYISSNQDAYSKLSTPPVKERQEITGERTTFIASKPQRPVRVRVYTKQQPAIINVADNNSNDNVQQITKEPTDATEENVTKETIINEEKEIEKTEAATSSSSVLPQINTNIPEQNASSLTVSENATISEPESESLKTDAELNYEVKIPVLARPKLKKEIQFYTTPSASYRILYAENLFAIGNLPQQDPDNAVTHHPALGLEAGVAIRFPVSAKFRFIAGLQANYTRYTVNAYRSAPQVATVRLNYSIIQQRVTTLANNNGYYPNKVANETYQFSIPLGVQMQLAGGKKVQWNLGAEVQPTYIMKASGYLITNDYTKYVQAPDLLSHLNINTSLQTFITWDAKKFRLFAGPQLRYQVFANVPEYPIQEHLIDYGFRLGIVKPLR